LDSLTYVHLFKCLKAFMFIYANLLRNLILWLGKIVSLHAKVSLFDESLISKLSTGRHLSGRLPKCDVTLPQYRLA
jgi:hypothetical protein